MLVLHTPKYVIIACEVIDVNNNLSKKVSKYACIYTKKVISPDGIILKILSINITKLTIVIL